MEKEFVGKGVHHIGMRSHNFEQTTKFYQEGLGFKIVKSWEWGENGKAYIMDTGNGCCFEIGTDPSDDCPPVGKFTHIALHVKDCKAAYERAIKAGAKPKSPPTFSNIIQAKPKPWKMWFAYIIGFDNEEIELIQEVED